MADKGISSPRAMRTVLGCAFKAFTKFAGLSGLINDVMTQNEFKQGVHDGASNVNWIATPDQFAKQPIIRYWCQYYSRDGQTLAFAGDLIGEEDEPHWPRLIACHMDVGVLTKPHVTVGRSLLEFALFGRCRVEAPWPAYKEESREVDLSGLPRVRLGRLGTFVYFWRPLEYVSHDVVSEMAAAVVALAKGDTAPAERMQALTEGDTPGIGQGAQAGG